jgi:hypothetical protein
MRIIEFSPIDPETNDVSLSWLRGGQTLLRAERGRPIQVWDVDTGELVRTGPQSDGIASWSPDHRALAVIVEGAVELLDARLSKLMRRLRGSLVDRTQPPTALAWSPNSQRIALGGREWVELWNPRTGKLLQRRDPKGSMARFMAFSPDSRLLAVDAGALSILHGGTLSVEDHFNNDSQPNGPGGLAFHPSSPLLATLSDDSTAVEIRELLDRTKLDKTPSESAQRSIERERPQKSSTLDQPVAPDELIRALGQKECMLFAGAGLSARAGLPVWFQFVEKFFDWAKAKQWFDEKYAVAL